MPGLDSLFARASPDALIREIGHERLERIEALLPDTSGEQFRRDTLALGKTIIALEGESTLEDERLRAVLFGLLPSDVLSEWAARWAKRSFDKPADNVLALASVPWKPGGGLAIELGNWFEIPSEYLPRTEIRQPFSSIVVPFSPLPPLRPYQEEVKESVVSALEVPPARVLVQMPTGAGKTRTIMSSLVVLAKGRQLFARGRSLLWLAHVEELCEQAIGAFQQEWWNGGHGTATAVRCFGTHRPNLDDYEGSFIVATYQKLAAMQRTGHGEFQRIAAHVDIIVADEAHKVMAPTFMAVLEDKALSHSSVVGITATPGRGLSARNENAKLATFFGKRLVGPSLGDNPIAKLRALGVLARVKYRAIESGLGVSLTPTELRASADLDLPTSALARLADSSERNRRIVEAILAETEAGRTCLVFACSVDHSRLLAAALTLRGCSAAHIDAEVSPRLRRSMIERFKDGHLSVLLNFGVLSTGFDAPRVGTVVVTRPTTSVVLYSQMVGRGLRGPASGGNAECNLLDVRDNFNSFGGVDEVYAAFADYWV